jgi:hypothetical protein
MKKFGRELPRLPVEVQPLKRGALALTIKVGQYEQHEDYSRNIHGRLDNVKNDGGRF